MSWFQKLLPPKIKRRDDADIKKSVPDGLWHKCPSCEAVLYHADLEKNHSVCPKCNHHHRVLARTRLDWLLDHEGRFEIGAEVLPIDTLKFKDQKKYSDRLVDAKRNTGEDDSVIVLQGSIHALPVVVACFEFTFMGGSM
ncbi:MAG: acetyl-CoA carboxylase carboxyl transferase subunit beta, partial [Gallionellaceae bacterium]